MLKITIPSCAFAQYYGSATTVEKMLDILKTIKKEQMLPFQKTGNKTSDFDYANNMRQLGFVDIINNQTFLTPRGKSLLIIKDVVEERHRWKTKLARFIILKSLADFDWECITSLLWYSQILCVSTEKLKELYKPSFSYGNFNKHWRSLHINLAKKISLLNHYLDLYEKYLENFNDERIAHEKASQEMNPYCPNFIGNKYFDVENAISEAHIDKFIFDYLPISLQIYTSYFNDSEIGNVEPLKTILLANALKEKSYISEIILSKGLLKFFLEKEIPVYKVLLGVQNSGRGLHYMTSSGFDYYPDFNLHVAMRKCL